MTFSLFPLLIAFILQPGLDNRISDQASYYLEAISKEKSTSENYWALNELYQSTCAINNSVIRTIINSDLNKTKGYFTRITCGVTTEDQESNKIKRILSISQDLGLFELYIYYLLNEPNKSEKELQTNEFTARWGSSLDTYQIQLIESILEGSKLSQSLLSDVESELVYYSILITRNLQNFISNENSQKLANSWIAEFDENYQEEGILSSIQLANITSLLFELDRYSQTTPFLENIYSDSYFPISFGKTRFLNVLGYSLFVIGRYDHSLKVIRNHLIPVSSYLNLKSRFDEATLLKGVNLYSLGKFSEAKDVFESIYNDENSTIEKAQLFNNLSICYLKLGEKNKYLTYQINALEEAKNASYTNRLIILRNLFVYYTSIKDSETALDYLKRAEKIAVENNDSYELAAIHAFSGTFFWDIYKDADRALEELSTAQKEFDPSTDYFDFVNALKEEAEILVSINRLSEAGLKFQELRELSVQSSNTPDYLEALIGLMEIAILKNDLDEASKILEEIKIYPQDDLDFELSVKYHTVAALLVHKQGDSRIAYNQIQPVVEQIIDRARTSINSQTGYWSISPEFIDAFNAVLSMLISLQEYNKAVQLLDELKTINDVALYNSPILRAQRLSEEDLARDQLLNDQIVQLRTDYLNADSPNEEFSIKAQIDQLSAQREEILNKIRTDISIEPISIWSLQRKLPQGEMIVHYTEVGDELYASYITHKTLNIEIISFDAKTKQLFENAANQIASSKADLNLLHEVYEVLNLKAYLTPEISSLIVIPDNYLYRLPIDILPIEKPLSDISYGASRYLIEDFNVNYFTSLNELVKNSRSVSKEKVFDFSAFALSDFSEFDNQNLPSLPFATEEVKNIADILGNFKNKNVYLEAEATKTAFLEGVANSKIIHVATHSEVSEQDPLFSTIYLNNNTSEELASLYAYELFDAKMSNDLIMLNSCSSGSGGYLQGSGIMGISRAVRYAGAKSLALNLWSVNDKTASEFASLFYSSINNGATKWEAMRNAKLTLLETGNANPYYWGAYMLIGNTSPLAEKPAKAGFLYPFLIGVIILVSFRIREKTY